MAKLEVKENKKLVLKNVLKKELRNIAMEELNKEIEDFGNMLQLLHVQVFGPLIIKNAGMQIHEDGIISLDYDLIVQAHDYQQYKDKYVTQEKIVAENCIYVRFEGASEEINYAYAKLDLYIYENDLIATGEDYTIHINNHPDYSVVDIFRVVNRNETL